MKSSENKNKSYEMKEYIFSAKIKSSEIGKGGAYIEFPYNVEKEFKTKGRVKVCCFFENVEYRGSLIKMGTSCHILGITKGIRLNIGKEIGDMVNVRLYEDKEERIVLINAILQKSLDSFHLMETYEKLSFTKRKEINGYINSAKKESTQISRINAIIEQFKKEKKSDC